MKEITKFDVRHMVDNTHDNDYRITRCKCIKIFKEKRMNVSVSKFIKLMGGDLDKLNISELTDKVNDIITQLRREWEIDKVLK